MAVLIGALLGLSTLLFIGPVFFYLLKSSVEDGFKAGFAVAIGIILGDIICVLLALYGVGDFFSQPDNIRWFALIGGIIVLFFGINYLIAKEKKTKEKFQAKKVFSFGINGFLINFINPFVFAVWFGFYAYAYSELGNKQSVAIALLTALLVIFSTDTLKALYANKLSAHISERKLKIIYKVIGVIMIGFSARLLVAFFQ